MTYIILCHIVKDIMTHIKQDINCKIKVDCQSSNSYNKHNVNVDDLLTSVKCLKRGKYDIDTGHCSEHLINGTHKLNVSLSLLYKAMLIHGYIPSTLLLSTVIPITHNSKKSLNDSHNYRGIALSSIV